MSKSKNSTKIPSGLITKRQSQRPPWRIVKYNHIEFWVSNPQQTADYYCTRLGFTRVAYSGLTTGNRNTSSHVVRQNKITFVFTGPYKPNMSSEYNLFISQHGDAVRDQAYLVTNIKKIISNIKLKGGKILQNIEKKSDIYGSVLTCIIWLYGNVTLTLIENLDYKGPFLPGYVPIPPNDDILQQKLDPVGLQYIDHVVANQPEGETLNIAEKFSKYLGFHMFWSVDSKDVKGNISSLKSIIMTDWDMNIIQSFNEPVYNEFTSGLSQIEEYLVYHGEPGVQHIALNTYDIVTSINALKERGMKFLTVDDKYYKDLRKRLNNQNNIELKEDLNMLEKLQILVDFDENGYLLQIFAQPIQDRPTLFFEIIQRQNHNGFGKGNYNALFKALEDAQINRGNVKRTEELKYKGSTRSKL